MIVYENEELNKAYEIASMAHKNQKDKEGIEYVNHPVAVSALVGSLEEKIKQDVSWTKPRKKA